MEVAMIDELQQLIDRAKALSEQAQGLAAQAATIKAEQAFAVGPDAFVISLTVFVLACFVGYFVVWRVTPALHTPLMAVTNAISGIIVVGAILAVGADGLGTSQWLGFGAVVLASINIFGGFLVTQRMLQMFKKKA
jgi:NAD(P) transhydrogenase subunit alpha